VGANAYRLRVACTTNAPLLRACRALPALALGLTLVAGCSSSDGDSAATATTVRRTTTTTGVYHHTGTDGVDDELARVPARVYVPNTLSGTVTVIDPATFAVIETFATGDTPQHVVPSWDKKTLWVNNNGERTGKGSLTAIDPVTGKPGTTTPVDDPYNMYFTPDGEFMIIVAEALQRLDFRDPQTLELRESVSVPCPGVNHIDWSGDQSYFLATCEFGGAMVKVDTATRKVLGRLELSEDGMPQDVRLVPSGRFFYVADMHADGVHVIDGERFEKIGFIPTGVGTHGIYPSRDGRRVFVTNRGSHSVYGARRPPGSISVIDPSAGELGEVVANWPVPDGGSPDMGNLTVDGKQFWISGRYDSEVYVFDTTTGQLLRRIPVGQGPHGLTIWPQPGRYSLGHTGNMR
jgi:YVTN family beta-propeller protein